MAEYLTTDAELSSIANAIRSKGGTTSSLTFPNDFVSAISNIEINPVELSVNGATVEKITGTEDDYNMIMSSN